MLASGLILPAVGCFGLALIRLRNVGNYRFASMSTIVVLLAIMLGGISVSGGPQESPVLQLLIIPPLTAFFFGGRLLGRSIALITLLIVTLLILLQAFGFSFPQTVESLDKRNILSFVVTHQHHPPTPPTNTTHQHHPSTPPTNNREANPQSNRCIQLKNVLHTWVPQI